MVEIAIITVKGSYHGTIRAVWNYNTLDSIVFSKEDIYEIIKNIDLKQSPWS